MGWPGGVWGRTGDIFIFSGGGRGGGGVLAQIFVSFKNENTGVEVVKNLLQRFVNWTLPIHAIRIKRSWFLQEYWLVIRPCRKGVFWGSWWTFWFITDHYGIFSFSCRNPSHLIDWTNNKFSETFSFPSLNRSLHFVWALVFLSFKSANNQFTQYDVLFLPRKQLSQELPRVIF